MVSVTPISPILGARVEGVDLSQPIPDAVLPSPVIAARARSFTAPVALSMLFGLLTLVAGAALARLYMRSVAADLATIEAGTTYLLWFLPALALEFVMQVIASALRATGIVRPGSDATMLRSGPMGGRVVQGARPR